MPRYNLNLNRKMDADLVETAASLDVPKAEVFRRALELYKLVVDSGAKTISYENMNDGKTMTVIVR